jgi:hypothetical protein
MLGHAMISYPVYKVFHVIAIVALVSGLVALLVLPPATPGRQRRLAHVVAGVAALVVLVSGFGLHARLGGVWQGWVVTKIAMWVALLGILVAFRRGPAASPAAPWLLALPVAAVAIFMAIYKPF